MHKVYIEFLISGTIIVDEPEKQRIMAEMSRLVSKFIRNKDIVEFQNTLVSSDEDEMIGYNDEIGEA